MRGLCFDPRVRVYVSFCSLQFCFYRPRCCIVYLPVCVVVRVGFRIRIYAYMHTSAGRPRSFLMSAIFRYNSGRDAPGCLSWSPLFALFQWVLNSASADAAVGIAQSPGIGSRLREPHLNVLMYRPID